MSTISITINGTEIEGFEATSIKRNLNSMTDGFTFSGPYDPDSPYAYLLEPPQKEVVLSIDGEKYITAISEKWDPGFEKNSSVTSIECRTRPGVLIECASTSKTSTYKNQTLSNIANSECAPFGITANFPDGDSPVIKIAHRCPTETVFSFLKKLACNYEFLITSTDDGNINFLKPEINPADVVDSLEQGKIPLLSVDTGYDFTKRFSEYTATGQFPGVPDAIATVVDPSVTQYRPIIFKSDAKDQASLLKAAQWRMTRALTAIEITIKVYGWRDRNGDLWRENKKINFIAPNVYLFKRYDYLIKNVALDKTESDGEIATLTLVMPESFTGEFPKILPWER